MKDSRMGRTCRATRGPALLLLGVGFAMASGAADAPRQLPSPYDILGTRHLETPVIDAVRPCVPSGLPPALTSIAEFAQSGDWQAARSALESGLSSFAVPPEAAEFLEAMLSARAAQGSADLRRARKALRSVLRVGKGSTVRVCEMLELTRVELLLGKLPEAAAQLARVDRLLPELADPVLREEDRQFYGAEIFYHSHRPFEAHLAYRPLAHSINPRIAAAARLRLTDLSFDGGKSEIVRVEYEALLPRAEAFGASVVGWALRAAEAALDAGDLEGAAVWLEQYASVETDVGLRHAVSIRQADVEALSGAGRAARARLVTFAERRKHPKLIALARARIIDLGLGSPDAQRRVEILRQVARTRHQGISTYALGVLLHETVLGGDLDTGLAVATRLAYESGNPILTPNFDADLELLFERAAAGSGDEATCRAVVNRLGGRYGVLIRRADRADPFLVLGACLEEMDLPTLAISVYRSVLQTFGRQAAERVALPLARTSLAAGDTAIARTAAEVHLRRPAADAPAWRLILAEAQQREGRYEEAARLLRQALEDPLLEQERVHMAALLARSLSHREQNAEDRELLVRVLESIPEAQRRSASREFAEALLLVADARRLAGLRPGALSLYTRAAEVLPEGPLRAEALYWAGALVANPERALAHWRLAAKVEHGGAWRRLARFELSFDLLVQVYGGPQS